MRIRKQPSAAEMLTRQLRATRHKQAGPVKADPFATEIAKRLEQRGIARVPGVTQEELGWAGISAENLHRLREIEAEREAQRDADHARTQPTTELIRRTIAEGARLSSAIPLNGSQILRAALAGGVGTINSERSR